MSTAAPQQTPTPVTQGPSGEPRPKPLLSVIIPTFNERGNIVGLVRGVLDVLSTTPAEVLVVDDNSPDGTATVVEEVAKDDSRVRLVARPGKQGLASAVFAGAEAARGEYVCAMDADLSHDPEELPHMLELATKGADLVIGSRFIPGAMFVGQPMARRLISEFLNTLARFVLMLKPKDVLSGYVLCRREIITRMPTRYSARGFKFLTELLVTMPRVRVAEWPICFRERRLGRSKASVREAREFASLCARLLWWRLRHSRKHHQPIPER